MNQYADLEHVEYVDGYDATAGVAAVASLLGFDSTIVVPWLFDGVPKQLLL